jgi:hypothetical protein
MRFRRLHLMALLAIAACLFSASAVFADSGRGGGGKDENEAEFKGVIQALPGGGSLVGDWTVSGRIVHVTSSTRIEQEDGPVRVGAFVEVKGRSRGDGSIDATRIETEDNLDDNGRGNGGRDNDEMQLKGTIQSLPATAGFIGDWVVGGRTVRVTSSTRIEQEIGPVVVGAFVEVKGTQLSDGVFAATKIEIKSNAGGNDARNEIKGIIQALPGGGSLTGPWTVSGRIVHVSSSTIIDTEHGAALVGALVEVHGILRADSSLDATRIEIKPTGNGNGNNGTVGRRVNFKGTIEVMPASGLTGVWVISGRTVRVTSSTRIKQQHGAVGVGVRVKVKGVTLSDGSIEASQVQVRD